MHLRKVAYSGDMVLAAFPDYFSGVRDENNCVPENVVLRLVSLKNRGHKHDIVLHSKLKMNLL